MPRYRQPDYPVYYTLFVFGDYNPGRTLTDGVWAYMQAMYYLKPGFIVMDGHGIPAIIASESRRLYVRCEAYGLGKRPRNGCSWAYTRLDLPSREVLAQHLAGMADWIVTFGTAPETEALRQYVRQQLPDRRLIVFEKFREGLAPARYQEKALPTYKPYPASMWAGNTKTQ